MQVYRPLDIINDHLLGGMKTVGELFGAGKMQLPFVLQSAETMKAAVKYLEPFMERVEGQEKGTIVLATVRGDVHDIGKNLVDIILTNNGYRVVNLGIKQPIGAILEAAREHRAHAIGMSGLLVKSTVVMRENLEEMSRQGIDLPVMLGGAALTRRYVEEDCVKAYASGRVAYARDAFDGLGLMDRIVGNDFDGYLAEAQRKNAGRPVNERRKLGRAGDARPQRPVDLEEIRLRRAELNRGVPVPVPPFWGAQTIARVPVKAVVPYLNERMLYQFQWGYRKDGRSLAEYKEWARKELRPVMARIADISIRENILLPQAAYGYWRCAAEGNDVILFDEDGPGRKEREVGRFSFPRQNKEGGLCVADFFRDVDDPERDVIGLAGRHDGAAGVGGGARVVRRGPLPGLPVPARVLGRDGRGVRRICAQAHPGRIGLRRRGGARPRRDAEPGLSRQPLFVRLPGLPEPRRPAPVVGPAARRRDRHQPDRGGPARPGAIDLGDRRPPPAGEVFFRVIPCISLLSREFFANSPDQMVVLARFSPRETGNFHTDNREFKRRIRELSGIDGIIRVRRLPLTLPSPPIGGERMLLIHPDYGVSSVSRATTSHSRAISRANASRSEAPSSGGSQSAIELNRNSAKVAAVRSRHGMRSASRARANVDSSSPRMRSMKSGGGGSSVRYGPARLSAASANKSG